MPVRIVSVIILGCVTLQLGYGIAYYVYSYGFNRQPVVVEGFEDITVKGWTQYGRVELCCDHSAEIVEETARQGVKAMRFTLGSTDPKVRDTRRAELRFPAALRGEVVEYKLSIYIPRDWVFDKDLVTVAQWHGVPDRIIAERPRSPPLRIRIQDDSWFIISRWDRNIRSDSQSSEGMKSETVWQAIVERGKWVDWKFKVHWSHGPDGQLDIWKDGEQIVDRKGPNTYNDFFAPFFKFGIYIPEWARRPASEIGKTRYLLIDNVSQKSEGAFNKMER